MKDALSVAAIQMQSGESVAANLERAASLLEEAASRGAQFALLPENFAFLGSRSHRKGVSESLAGAPGPIRRTLSALAKHHQMAILAGGWLTDSSDPERPYNTATLFGKSGNIESVYRKIHLFDVQLPDGKTVRESDVYSPGSEVTSAEVEGFRVGHSICYDLRFPELYRKLVDQGAEVLCVPAAFTAQTGRAHWEVLCRARAIESQCYLIAANQQGSHNENPDTYGNSMIVDPWGEILSRCESGAGVITATVERDRLNQFRERLPCLKHRRVV